MAVVCQKVHLIINDDSNLVNKIMEKVFGQGRTSEAIFGRLSGQKHSNRSHLRWNQAGMFCYASDDRTDYTRHLKGKGREFSIKLDDITDNTRHSKIQQ